MSFRDRMCLLGVPKQNFTFRPYFLTKRNFFGQFLTGHKISRQKDLNNGDAHL